MNAVVALKGPTRNNKQASEDEENKHMMMRYIQCIVWLWIFVLNRFHIHFEVETEVSTPAALTMP